MKKEIRDRLIKIAKKFDLEVLILFGSRANNTQNKNSDWDFAYLSFKEIDKIKLLNEFEKLLINVDLVDLKDNISFFLKKEIFENGELIYEKKEGIFEELRIEVSFEYLDNLDYLNEYQKYLESNLKI